MAAVLRLTSIKVSSAPNPVLRVTSIAVTSTRTPVIRLTSIRVGSPSAVLRLTSIKVSRTVAGSPPVASAGNDVQMGAGEQRVLDGSEVTSGSAVATRQWRIMAKSPTTSPDLALSSASVSDPVVRGPVMVDDTTYQLGYQVTDVEGFVSVEDTVTVLVFGADRAVCTSTGWVPAARLVCTPDGWV